MRYLRELRVIPNILTHGTTQPSECIRFTLYSDVEKMFLASIQNFDIIYVGKKGIYSPLIEREERRRGVESSMHHSLGKS